MVTDDPTQPIPDDDQRLSDLQPTEPRPTSSDALAYVQDRAQPVETTPKGAAADEDAAEHASRFLTSLLARSLFFDYFVRLADRRYTGKNLQPKVRHLIDDHPRFYAFVLVMDMIILVTVVMILLAAAVVGLFKTLAPLPSLW